MKGWCNRQRNAAWVHIGNGKHAVALIPFRFNVFTVNRTLSVYSEFGTARDAGCRYGVEYFILALGKLAAKKGRQLQRRVWYSLQQCEQGSHKSTTYAPRKNYPGGGQPVPSPVRESMPPLPHWEREMRKEWPAILFWHKSLERNGKPRKRMFFITSMA